MPSYSVPTSPTMAHPTYKGQPVTPQRLPAQRLHRYSSSHSFKSPISPASPYTPSSLRSFASSCSGGSSTLNTPDHAISGLQHFPYSPDVGRRATGPAAQDQSLADIAENWRSRASENGIKVTSLDDGSHFADDEASERTTSDFAVESGFISTEEALLAPSLISDQRRSAFTSTRPRSLSHASVATSSALSSPPYARNPSRNFTQTSPLVSRRLNQPQNADTMATPPQNRALARQLKLKGSFTDPAQPRRREAFSPLRTPAQNTNKTFTLGVNRDTSLDLFDIDENDYENEYDRSADSEIPGDTLMNFKLHTKHNIANYTSKPHEYANHTSYNFPLPTYGQQQQFFSHSQPPFADPFQGNALNNLTESVEHYFHTQKFGKHQVYGPDLCHSQQYSSGVVRAPVPADNDGYSGSPLWVPVPVPSTTTPTSSAQPVEEIKLTTRSGCSVCLASSPHTLAILMPCKHPLCSTCLTSALNIVGEKDMECAMCRGKVADFKLVTGDGLDTDATKIDKMDTGRSKTELRGNQTKTKHFVMGDSFMDPLSSPLGSRVGRGSPSLANAFEIGLGLEGIRASTPRYVARNEAALRPQGLGFLEEDIAIVAREHGHGKNRNEENIVLRIDNVPWDVTPPQVQKWLQQPLERVHVLLDKKGKTMSHAYVEVSDVTIGGKILRGEAQSDQAGGKPRERGSVLGTGRRARGVTITRTGQEELMADLFPSWRGSFDGSRPSLLNLDNERVIDALEGGLISESEVVGLLHLMKEPDSHFLKTPSLPFYSLISILYKFPADVDSRVFWSSGVRDMLYDVTYAAIQILLARVNTDSGALIDKEYSMELVSDLVKTALGCHAFTTQQLSKFMEFLEKCSLPTLYIKSVARVPSEPRTPESLSAGGLISNAPTIVGDGILTPSPIESGNNSRSGNALAELAREFGVEAQLVHALAQRLAGL